MSEFTYNDKVRLKLEAPSSLRPGQIAWVILVVPPQDRVGVYFDQFPTGTVYSIEYENGEAADIHESFLESGS